MKRFTVLLVGIAVAACGQGIEGNVGVTSTSLPPTTTVTNAPSTSTEASVTDTTSSNGSTAPRGEDVLITAIKDLSRRLDVPEESIEVESATDGYWNDASIGCPVDGELYAQLIMNGYRIELAADGTTYVYHQGGTEPVFLCDNPEDDAFVPGKTIPEPSIPPPRD